MILNAGTAIINAALHATGVTREDSSFATQIPNIYSVAGPNGTRHLEYRFDVDLIHVGMPKIDSPLPPPLATAFSEMQISRSFVTPTFAKIGQLPLTSFAPVRAHTRNA